MDLFSNIIERNEKIAVVGLGYVGLPLAIAFAKKADVIGFDLSKVKINEYKKGIDVTCEVGNAAIKNTTVQFTYDKSELKSAMFYIVAVPTPINADKTPDLSLVKSASAMVGSNIKKGAVVVFESTVYPGVTEEVCVPILEKESGLVCGQDFKVGYSPERINPGDKVHRLETIVKIVSGMDKESLDTIAKVYELVVDAGVFRAESIKVAEAAKVIENAQRDINIAFMNELSIIFNRMNIDTKSVLQAAGTKWNFLNFTPGLVGGHCIGVDPYYLTYRASMLGYDSKIILSGRTINDSMGSYVAEQTVKKLIKAGAQIKGAKVAIFGITFKENCPDVRNTKTIDIINELKEYGVDVKIVDDVADKHDLKRIHNMETCDMSDISDIDACIFTVAHNVFKDTDLKALKKAFKNEKCVLMDIKGIFDRDTAQNAGYIYWRL